MHGMRRTLFVVSSKSGGTVEPLSMWAHFWKLIPDGRRFVAITDPGSGLEELARERRLPLVRLETNKALTEAQSLYRSSGYREVRAFNDEAYAHHWFEKALRPTSRGDAPRARARPR